MRDMNHARALSGNRSRLTGKARLGRCVLSQAAACLDEPMTASNDLRYGFGAELRLIGTYEYSVGVCTIYYLTD